MKRILCILVVSLMAFAIGTPAYAQFKSEAFMEYADKIQKLIGRRDAVGFSASYEFQPMGGG